MILGLHAPGLLHNAGIGVVSGIRRGVRYSAQLTLTGSMTSCEEYISQAISSAVDALRTLTAVSHAADRPNEAKSTP